MIATIELAAMHRISIVQKQMATNWKDKRNKFVMTLTMHFLILKISFPFMYITGLTAIYEGASRTDEQLTNVTD